MKFILSPEAGKEQLILSGDEYKYVIKVRRHSIGDLLSFRDTASLTQEYRYRLERTDGRNAYFSLQSEQESACENPNRLHIGWCLIDPKTIEKTLPMLSELGVAKITFIHCSRSQRNFKPDFKRFERIMESSIMQCGRTSMIELSESSSVKEFLKSYPDPVILDFDGDVFNPAEEFETVIIGCEGGFDESERKLFADCRVRRFSSPMILRSETAAVAVSAMKL